MPFKFVISLLSILEKREYPLFLRGGKSQVLKKAEKNIRATFPGLKIVGRREGKIRRQEEPAVIEAIRKSSPSILLVGKGIRGKELWIARNSSRLNSGFRLWCSDLFDVFAEKKHRPKDAVFEKGLECIGYCLSSPLKFFRVFLFIYYNLLLLANKISKR
jgi:N-acetylglucosaminyldiphosphoundecaprenol N-acetyl-beta-D-mannosaminyltransferase